MTLEPADFVHPSHLGIFIEAAHAFRCHILVRETGRASLQWVGRAGYTGKRADMKANTANRDCGDYRQAGLVCSPLLVPQAFSADRLTKAQKNWRKSAHLISVPNGAGLDDRTQPIGCRTPYVLQTNRRHRHYGCVALVGNGLLLPRYVHGDYDLYAIIPVGEAFDPDRLEPRLTTLGSTMSLAHLGLAERLARERELKVDNMEGPLSLRVATFINNSIDRRSGDVAGSLMVNHGEQVNVASMRDCQTVLAISPGRGIGGRVSILSGSDAHQQFYRAA